MSWRAKPQSEVLADGRTVHAVQPTPLDPWTVWIDDDIEAAQTGGWLLSLLAKVLGAPPGKAPDYVFGLVERFAAVRTPVGVRYQCPCCEFLTLEAQHAHRICEVCGWQDDLTQSTDPDIAGGANRPSLRQARANYAQFQRSDENKARVRSPLPEELPPA